MLHIFRHSPFRYDMKSLLRYVKSGDDLLLMEDGVIAGLGSTYALELMLSAPISILALWEDVEVRGLLTQLSPKIECVGYTKFVRLTVKHDLQLTW